MKSLPKAIMIATATAALLLGCSDKPPTNTFGNRPSAMGGADGGASEGGLPATVAIKTEYAENEFTEGEKNRDPFRSFASTFAPQNRKLPGTQIDAVLAQFSVDEMKLVAIVTGGDYPRAMLLDPQGKGWVVKRGDYLGKPDIVHVGGSNGSDYSLSWRVDRIRDGDIVLVRLDPSQPAVAPATRVIPLHPESDDKNQL